MDLALAGAFVVIAAKLRLEPSRTFNPLLLVVFFPLIVLVHEAGHAAAALLVGHRVLEVKIGAGPSVSVWPGACPLVVRAEAELDARRSRRDGAVAESG